jgi:hypothetical protein
MRWFDLETEDSIYKRDLQKRIELLNWTLENMKNPDIYICALIESKKKEIILKNRIAAVKISDRIVHLERSLPVIFQSRLCDMDYRWLEYGVFLTLVYTCFF